MQTIESLLALPVLQTLGWTMIHSLWQGGLVALSMGSATFLLRRSGANARYLVGCTSLILMLLLPALTIWQMSPASQSPTPPLTVDEQIQPQPTGTSRAAAPVLATPPTVPEPTPHSLRMKLLAFASLSPPWLALFWLAGVLLLSARLAGGWFYARRLKVKETRPVESKWQRLLEDLALRMGINRTIRFLESGLAKVPAVVGGLRPVILVPAAALTGLSVTQLEAVLTHELAHIRRHDYLVNLLQAIVETLLFYHPAVWWISRQIRNERENCCDDWAVSVCGDARTYALALTHMEEARRTSPSLSVAASGGRLIDRIRRLLKVSPPRRDRGPGWLGASLCAGLLLIIGFAMDASVLESSPGPEPKRQPAGQHLSQQDQAALASITETVTAAKQAVEQAQRAIVQAQEAATQAREQEAVEPSRLSIPYPTELRAALEASRKSLEETKKWLVQVELGQPRIPHTPAFVQAMLSDAYVAAAQYHEKMGNLEKALSHLQYAQSLNPPSAAVIDKVRGRISEKIQAMGKKLHEFVSAFVFEASFELDSHVTSYASKMDPEVLEKITSLSEMLDRPLETSLRKADAIRQGAESFKPFQLKTLRGESRSLDNFQQPVLLISFIFPSCGPCLRDAPVLEEIYQRYKDQGLEIIAINTDPERSGSLSAWREDSGTSFPVLGGATRQALKEAYGVYPGDRQGTAYFLLNRQRQSIFKHWAGQVVQDGSLEAEIRHLLGQESGFTPVKAASEPEPESPSSFRLQIHPERPEPGQRVRLSIEPGSSGTQARDWTLFYGLEYWDTFLQRRKEAKLQFRGDQLWTSIELPPDAAYLAVLVKGPGVGDDGGEPTWWDTYLYRNGQPARKARLERGLMSLRGRLGQDEKESRALTLFSEEIKVYPETAEARAQIWAIRHQLAGYSQESRDDLEGEISNFLEDRKDKPWAWKAAIIALNQIRRGFVVDLAREATRRFPDDESFDFLVLHHLQGRPADLEELPNLSQHWKENLVYWNMLFRAYVWRNPEPELLYKVGKELLARTPKEMDEQGEARLLVAEAWLKHKVDPGEAEKVARAAVSIAEVRRADALTSESTHDRDDANLIREFSRSPLGWALYQQGRYQEALSELQRAVQLREELRVRASALYYRLGATLEKLNRGEEAREAYLKELAWGSHVEPLTRKALGDLQLRLGGSQEELELLIKQQSLQPL